MSRRKTSKRARFANQQSKKRWIDRAIRENKHRPGFVGVLTFNGPKVFSRGILSWR